MMKPSAIIIYLHFFEGMFVVRQIWFQLFALLARSQIVVVPHLHVFPFPRYSTRMSLGYDSIETRNMLVVDDNGPLSSSFSSTCCPESNIWWNVGRLCHKTFQAAHRQFIWFWLKKSSSFASVMFLSLSDFIQVHAFLGYNRLGLYGFQWSPPVLVETFVSSPLKFVDSAKLHRTPLPLLAEMLE